MSIFQAGNSAADPKSLLSYDYGLELSPKDANSSAEDESESNNRLSPKCSKIIELTFNRGSTNSDQVHLKLITDPKDGCGGIVWPAGQILSAHLGRNARSLLAGKNVLELGSGTGLVGIAATLLGARHVWLTDQIPMLSIMQENVLLNDLSPSQTSVVELNWGDALPLNLPKMDIILAADCVYLEWVFPLLVRTLSDLCTPDTDVLFCWVKRRRADKRFFSLLKKEFTWHEVRDFFIRLSGFRRFVYALCYFVNPLDIVISTSKFFPKINIEKDRERYMGRSGMASLLRLTKRH